MSGRAVMRVELRQGLAGLASLERDWHDLNSREATARAMSRFEWYDALLRHRVRDPETVYFAVIFAGQVCQAILPLAPMANAPGWLRWLQPWSLPTDPHANLCDVPVSRDFCLREAHGPLWQTLDTLSPRPRVLCLPLGLEGCNAEQGLRNTGPWLLTRSNGHSCQFDTREGYDTLAARYGSRLRKSVKRGRSKLSQGSPWQVVRITDPAGMETAFMTFLGLEASGWKGRDGTSSAIALDERTTAFYRHLFLDHGQRLGAEIDILMAGDRAIAVQLALNSPDMRHTLKIAYDESCTAQAPGLVLLDALLRTTCEGDDRRYFSLTTCTGWMQDWHPAQIPVLERWLFRSRLTASIVRILSRLATGARATAREDEANSLTRTAAG